MNGIGTGMTALKENLEKLEEAIGAACRRAGRARDEVELMAVSKTYPAATIAEAAELGLTTVRRKPRAGVCSQGGGCQVRGARARRCHLIGHLQSNKAKRAAELFDGVDSLDSVHLAERLNEAAGKLAKRLPVLIEVKLSPEETKSGVEPESSEAATLLETLPGLPHLEVRGLMTIAPWGVAEDVTRACFRSLSVWRDKWAAEISAIAAGCVVDGHERRFCARD